MCRFMLEYIIMTKYKAYLKSLSLAETTIASYLWHLDKFLSWLDQEKLTKIKLEEYYQYLLKRYKKVSTINLRLIILNSYLKFLNNKFRFDLLSNEPKDILILTSDQLQQFLDNPTKNKTIIGLRDKSLLELLYATGLKVGQIIELQITQIDDLSKEIILNKQSHLKIPPLAWFHLNKYLLKRNDTSDWLFINFDRSNKTADNHLTVRSVERIVTKYAKGLNPPLTINPQILRNTLAQQLKQEGAIGQHIKESLHFKTKAGASNYLKRL